MSVLVIEDDPDVFSTIEAVIHSFAPDCRILNIRSGKEFAQDVWKNEPWQLILLDLMLPGITGFDLCKILRAHDNTSQVPIVALTGLDTPESRERILGLGATAYFPKPFEVPELMKVLKTYLRAA